jgi:hypothetical protein
MHPTPLLLQRLLVAVLIGFSSILKGQLLLSEFQENDLFLEQSNSTQQIIQGNIKPEYLLSSIRKNYCALQLFDPNGVELKTNGHSTTLNLEEVVSFFESNSNRIRFISDSSSFLQQQALHWKIASSNSPVFEHYWTIVCYFTKSNAVEAQQFRQERLSALQLQHPEFPIQLVFIQQDF